jgi:hypothetical protein
VERPLSACEIANSWVELSISLLSGILAFLTQYNRLPEPIRSFLKNNPQICWAWLGLLGLIFLISIWRLLRPLFIHRSQLLQPDRFIIRTDERRHLKGREDELKELADLCERQPLVFMEGESGAGKSALVQAGLLDECERRRRLHPIYVDLSGAGWEDRLQQFICHEVWLSLSDDDRKLLGLKNPFSPQELFSVFAGFASRLSRTPVLIFDQFDDYQNTYRDHFREGLQANTWITGETLIQINTFWREIARLVQAENVHCLFVTRADNAAGLDTVRFVKAKTFRLARLSQNLVAPLLDEITIPADNDRPVVAYPAKGWERLKGRLLRDLAQDGLILPVQLSLFLQALTRLPALTVGEYERQGGSRGLERFHLERQIRDASRVSGLTADQARRVLVSLIEPVKGKTTQRLTSELLTVLQPADKSSRRLLPQQLHLALEHLEGRAIIRRRPAEAVNEDAWLLHHDFLCRGVLAVERHANRWHALIQEQARQYRRSAGLLRRFKALLSPWQQLRLLGMWLAGKFRYAEYRRFALVSMVRFLPLLLLPALYWLGSYSFHIHQDNLKAAQIFAGIRTDDQLRVLADSPCRVQWQVLRLAFQSNENAKKALDHFPIIVHLCVRLDPTGALRRRYWREIVSPALKNQPGTDTLLLAAVGWPEAPSEPSAARDLARALVEAVSREEPKSNNYYNCDKITKGIAALAPDLDLPSKQSLADRLLAERDKKRPIKGIAGLAAAFDSLAPDLTPFQARRLAINCVDDIILWDHPYPQRGILKKVAPLLDSEVALSISQKYLDSPTFLNYPYHMVQDFRWSFPYLLERLNDSDKSSLARQFSAAIMSATDTFALVWFTTALGLLADQSDLRLREGAVAKVVDSLERQDDTAATARLAEALKYHLSIITPEQGRSIAAKIFHAMAREKDPQQLLDLGEELQAYAKYLNPHEAQSVCAQQLKEIEYAFKGGSGRAEDNGRRIKIISGFSERLKEVQRLIFLDEFIFLVEHNKDQHFPFGLSGLKEIAKNVDYAQIQPRAERLVQLIEQEKNDRAVGNLRSLVTSLGITFPSDLQRRLRARIIHLMETRDSDLLLLAWDLASLHDATGGDLDRRGAELLLQAIVKQKTYRPEHYTEILAKFSDVMDQKQVQKTVGLLLTPSLRGKDTWDLLGIWGSTRPLWRRAPSEQLESLAGPVSARLAQFASQAKLNSLSPKEMKTLSEFFSYAPGTSLVNLLKQPFTVAETRTVILQALELKYGIPFENNLWKFVGWATSNKCPAKLNLN